MNFAMNSQKTGVILLLWKITLYGFALSHMARLNITRSDSVFDNNLICFTMYKVYGCN